MSNEPEIITTEEKVEMGAPPSKANQFIAHLTELRKRLLRCVAITGGVFVVLFYYANPLFEFLATPLLKKLPSASTLIATSVTGTFVAPMKLAFFVSIFLTMPFLFYQLWSFLSPGLYAHERRMIWPLLFFSSLLFYLGMAFAYTVVFPLLFRFFVLVAPHSIQIMPDLSSYINFCLKLFFAFGITFEVPIITVLLIASNVLSLEQCKRQRPYVVVFAFVVGMLLTPPDVLSQLLLALPLLLLYECGLIIAKLMKNRKK